MTRAKARPPKLPRAVRELLRDVVLSAPIRGQWVPMPLVERAARVLGASPDAIVARARKAVK